jgi:hypothetical protein
MIDAFKPFRTRFQDALQMSRKTLLSLNSTIHILCPMHPIIHLLTRSIIGIMACSGTIYDPIL